MAYISVENIGAAPSRFMRAKIYDEIVEIHSFGRLLKKLLEDMAKSNSKSFNKIINSGVLRVYRFKKPVSIVAGAEEKDRLKQPSKLLGIDMYIDTQVHRQEALDIIKSIVELLNIKNKIYIEEG